MNEEFNLETKDEIKRNIDHGVFRLATELKEDIDNKFYKANEKLINQTVLINILKLRIDKAIDYLKSRKDDNSMCSVCSVMTDELLDILKGRDKNG